MAYADLFISILSKVTGQEDTVLYTLCLLEEMLAAGSAHAQLFHAGAAAARGADALYGPLLRLLQKPTWGVQQRAALALAKIMAARPDKGARVPGVNLDLMSFEGTSSGEGEGDVSVAHAGAAHAAMHALMDFLCKQLERTAHEASAVPAACKGLAALLTDPAARAMFLTAGGPYKLSQHLKDVKVDTGGAGVAAVSVAGAAGGGFSDPAPPPTLDIQMLYEGGLCLWLMTFEPTAASAMAATPVLQALITLLKGMAKEKVVRVAALALASLSESNAAELVALGCKKAVQAVKLHTWADDELIAALDLLEERLAECASTMSSFEEYRRQLLSGALGWGTRHEDDRFWRENAARFVEEDFQMLRVLVALLGAARDSATLAVAVHDLGKFVQHHPSGRQVIMSLKGKDAVMALMAHADPDVQKQALICGQKLLVQNWGLLTQQTS